MSQSSPLKNPGRTQPLTVVLADDHNIVRTGFRSLVNELGYQVVGEASDGKQALSLIAQHHPDVVLMDISMPGMNGLEATDVISRDYPEVRVIILSGYANAEYAQRALHAGAAGYLLKVSLASELALAIDSVVQGDTYLTPAVAKLVVQDMRQSNERPARRQGPLTPRQEEVLKLIASGYSRKEIAKELGISVKTFDTLRSQIIEALEIHDTAGLVNYANRMGLLDQE